MRISDFPMLGLSGVPVSIRYRCIMMVYHPWGRSRRFPAGSNHSGRFSHSRESILMEILRFFIAIPYWPIVNANGFLVAKQWENPENIDFSRSCLSWTFFVRGVYHGFIVPERARRTIQKTSRERIFYFLLQEIYLGRDVM